MTAPSKRSQDTVALGTRIVTELGLAESTDTLSRWMSHRIAQLMDDAAHARTRALRDEAGEACESLILRLWERRTAWPRGWPPPVAVKVLDRLSVPEVDPDVYRFYRPRPVDEGARTWTDTFPLIADLQRAELEIWRDAGLLEVDVAELREWLEHHADDMDDSERDALDRLASAAERARERVNRLSDPRLSLGEVDESAADPRKRLEDIQRHREQLIERVVNPPKPRTARRRPRQPNNARK